VQSEATQHNVKIGDYGINEMRHEAELMNSFLLENGVAILVFFCYRKKN